MAEFFLEIVNMSISASWLVLAVLALRLILKKAPKWVNVLLWGIVAVRLICPVTIESALSLIPSSQTVSPEIMLDATPRIHTGVQALNSMVNPIITQSFTPDPAASANPLQIWIPVWANLWLLGVLVMLAYTAGSYLSLRRKVGMAVILRDNIFLSEYVVSPFILGILRPRIYLPYAMDEGSMGHVIAHEQAHLRRRDHWWKPLGFLLLAVHWFNPLMWAAYILLCRDIELACDEKVIKELGHDQRADYSQALLSCSVNRRRIAACPLAFGEVGVKERVKNVLNYKKPAFWIILVALIACVAVAVCFLTDPVNSTVRNPWVQEYTPGQGNMIGNVDKTEFESVSGDFAIGADQYGRAVFKDPHGAFDTMTRLYADGIDLIRQEFDLKRFSASGYEMYKTYGWQVSGGTEEARDQAAFVTKFLDIYENSFTKDTPAQPTITDGWYTTGKVSDKYYLTVAAENVDSIEIYTPSTSGGCYPHDGFAMGEKVHLEPLDGFSDLSGVTVTAKDADDNEIFSFGVPRLAEGVSVNVVSTDGWLLAPGDMDAASLAAVDIMAAPNLQFESGYACYSFMEEDDLYGSKVVLWDDGTFRFSFSAISSYLGVGNYEIVDGQLILRTSNGSYTYCFDIDTENDQLIFDSENSSDALWYSKLHDGAVLERTVHDSQVWEEFSMEREFTISLGVATMDGTASDRIVLRNLHNGVDTSIIQREEISAILEFLKGVKGVNPVSSRGYYGGCYEVSVYNGDVKVFSIGFGDDNAFNYGIYGDGYPTRYELQGMDTEDVINFFSQYDSSQTLPDWGIALTEENVTPDGMTLVCTQSGGNPSGQLESGSYYTLEAYRDGQWTALEVIADNLVWTEEAWIISEGGTAHWEVDWSFVYGTLPVGQYRIGKQITDFRGPGDYDTAMYYAEFVIG